MEKDFDMEEEGGGWYSLAVLGGESINLFRFPHGPGALSIRSRVLRRNRMRGTDRATMDCEPGLKAMLY